MQANQIENLLKRYTTGQCSEEEKALVETAYLSYLPEVNSLTEEEITEDLLRIRNALPKDPKHLKIRIFRFAAAAAVLLIVSAGLLYYQLAGNQNTHKQAFQKTEKILPGTDRAILTLADGRKIALDKNAAVLFSDSASGISIRKTAKGELIYETLKSTGGNQSANAYNTIETPKGSQYKIILPDGTNVWLNAASSLRYPVVFNGPKREVELSGEGYFEVAKDPHMPFNVKSAKQTVEVLGTHFNINAYPDEQFIKTTLLEGKVVVSQSGEKKLMKPGQQVTSYGQTLTLDNLSDAQESVAWKNGIFLFHHEDLHSIMNRVSRWYDIEVEYKNEFNNQYYSGTISKFDNVTDVLKIMEMTGSVRFRIVGRRITVMK